MQRREFTKLISSAVVAWPLIARAQQLDGIRRVGVLMPFAANDPSLKPAVSGFVRQLQELGWEEGRNLKIEYRFAAGDGERMQALAKELVALQPHVIFARSTPVTAALLKHTHTIPIVFAVVSDPVGDRFVESLARPGRNATGFTNVESSMAGKWLELLREVAPSLKRVAFIFDPELAPWRIVLYAHDRIQCAIICGGVNCHASSRCGRH